MKFQKGQSGNPKGKAKGAVSKFTSLKAAFLNVFERMGGEDALLEWANSSNHNKAAFYQWITKMLPADVNVSGEVGHTLKFDFENGNGNGKE
jgi:hypothetical protein